MGRNCQRVCLQDGFRLNLNSLIRQGLVLAGGQTSHQTIRWVYTYTGEQLAQSTISADLSDSKRGWFRIVVGTLDQMVWLERRQRHFGGGQVSRRFLLRWKVKNDLSFPAYDNFFQFRSGLRGILMNGEKIYEYDVEITGATDFGVSLDAILSGQEKVPPQGARINVAFAGQAEGRLSGRVQGVDFLQIRADGRFNLDIRATIETSEETSDGQRIALSADGVASLRAAEPVADLCENVSLVTASKDYAWVNSRQIWAIGTVNLATGKIHIEAYMQ